MELDDKDERRRMQSMDEIFREEEMKLLAAGAALRAKETSAWASVRDLMVRLGVRAPKKRKK